MNRAMFEGRRNPVNPFECYYSVRFTEPWVVKAHYHDFIEILYFVEGTAHVLMNGREQPVREGDLVFINSQDVHAIYGDPGVTSQHIILKFDPALLYNTVQEAIEMKYVRPFLGNCTVYKQIFHRGELAESDIVSTVFSLAEQTAAKSYAYSISVRIGILQIVLWVLQQWERQGYAMTSGNEAALETLFPVFEFVQEHYVDDIDAGAAAMLCNMSYSSFSRKFKQVMGSSFVEYVNYTRVQQAEKLLTQSDCTVSEAATRCGFSNVSYFIKQFRRFKRLSPKQFQIRMQKRISADGTPLKWNE